MWTSLRRKYTYKYTKVNKHLKQLFCVSQQSNFTVNAESGLARARKGGNVFYHQREPRSLKRDVKQCLLLKMLAWGSQRQLWWRILTEFALISALCNSSTHTHTHARARWCHRPTLHVSHSAHVLLKYWVIGAEQRGCALCRKNQQVWRGPCLLLQFICK